MDEIKNYPPYLDYPKPYKAEVSTDCINRKAFIGEIEKHYCARARGKTVTWVEIGAVLA